MSYLEEKTDEELVDIIIDWLPGAPTAFRPAWTFKMKRIVGSGGRLTPRQRLGTLNVIVKWNCDGRHPVRQWHRADL